MIDAEQTMGRWVKWITFCDDDDDDDDDDDGSHWSWVVAC